MKTNNMKTLLLITCLSISLFACKKDPVIPSVTRYELSSPRQHDENEFIYVYNNAGTLTISTPINSTVPHIFPLHFGGVLGNGGNTWLTGDATIHSDVLKISYTAYAKGDSSIRQLYYVNQATYLKTY